MVSLHSDFYGGWRQGGHLGVCKSSSGVQYGFLGQSGFEKAKKHAYLPLLECSSWGTGGQNETEGSTLKFMGCLSSKNIQRGNNQISILIGGHWANEYFLTGYLSILTYRSFVPSFIYLLVTLGGCRVESCFSWHKIDHVPSYFNVVKYTSSVTRIFRYKFNFIFKGPDPESFHWDLGCREISPTVFTYVMIKFGLRIIWLIRSVNNEIWDI